MRDASFCLLPNLRSRACVVRLPIGIVVVLVGVEEAFRLRPSQFLGLFLGAVGAVTRIGKDKFRSVGLQDRFPLMGGVGGQAQSDFVTLGRADPGVGDAGVAAGGIQ